MKDLKADKPSYGKESVLKASNGNVVYIQVVEGLPKTADGRTSGQYNVTLVNQDGWKVNGATVN